MTEHRVPAWRDVRTMRITGQVAFVAALVAAVLYLRANLITNLNIQGIRTDFGFLSGPAGFQIPGTDFSSGRPVSAALLVGVKNTVLVAALGIVLATALGVVVGIARLSSNWLVRTLARVFVESLRNVPVVVIIIFWSTAVLLKLPHITEPTTFGGAILSNRGLWVPWVRAQPGAGAFMAVAAVGLVASGAMWTWRTSVSERSGAEANRWRWAVSVLVATTVAGFIATGSPVTVVAPTVDGVRVSGGTAISPEYAAVLLGLVIYTASHIAEIVRGSIQAVPRGQIEAATALGLTPWRRLRLVVLPQAFRVAVPPTANQYLNLTKNTSLGIFVAYAELTAITFIVIGNANPAPQAIALMMVVYLVLSLTISAGTNAINRRLQRSERR